MSSGENDMAEEVWTDAAKVAPYFLDVARINGCRAPLANPRSPLLICDVGHPHWLKSNRLVNRKALDCVRSPSLLKESSGKSASGRSSG
jgi:hypothetical protein